MKEFSEAADELFRAGKEGAISGPVVTDYGVHILYLSRIIPSGGLTVGLNAVSYTHLDVRHSSQSHAERIVYCRIYGSRHKRGRNGKTA